MIERHHLRIISAVQEFGTLTEAAMALHLTQSALSHAIRKLENQLGTPIWQKDGRNLRLTASGELLLNLGQRVLPQFEHAEAVASLIANGQQGLLRIGMECHPCYKWLLKVVAPFIEQHPHVEVDVKQAFQFGGMKALLGYEIDVLVTPDPLYMPSVDYLPIMDYEHVLVVSPQHSLAKAAFVTPEQLAQETLLTYPVEPSRLDIFSRFLTPAGVNVGKHKIIEATEIMLALIHANRGISALPRWLVEEYQSDYSLSAIQLGQTAMRKTMYLGTRTNEASPNYIEAFKHVAVKVAKHAFSQTVS
ncbi:LysR family transcriptional regulator [Aestuariibacter sp. AA17]|uniref:HTH-type transcriptional regulator MetR n=1 Tax=Fluctibacter corallii TaxID=2984329 RepID=A0ABT3A457_9ALTE|nr:LysR family transcriptional regulator [Aestuariibacter sp. AA17]MCV2883314.1 LysR family transcriptional regulator [Aestuariibacter sp. AA17]